MSFMTDWKTAKTAFENATKAKKPTATLLGVFRKGTGIESALKSADGAKTAGDLRKAMAAFASASKTYSATLDKAINDPKATAVADKAAYAAAAKKLKEALKAIADSAERTAASLDGAAKKDQVDPAQLRKWADADKAAKDHIALRQRMAVELKKVLADYQAKGKQVEAASANAAKQLATAKAAKAKGDTMGADVAANAAERFAEQAQSLLAPIDGDWKKRTAQGSDLMRAREDNKGAFDALAPDKMAAYKKASGDAFAAGDATQRQIQGYLAVLKNAVEKAAAASETAEAYRISGTRPDVHVARVSEMRKVLDGLVTTLSTRAMKLNGPQRDENRRHFQGLKGAKDPAFNNKCKQMKALQATITAKHKEDIGRLNTIASRLKAIPETALDDKAVNDAVKAANAALEQAKRHATAYLAEEPKFVAELDGYIGKT